MSILWQAGTASAYADEDSETSHRASEKGMLMRRMSFQEDGDVMAEKRRIIDTPLDRLKQEVY